MSNTSSPIGIFDSGIGGLTVAYAIAEILPREQLMYLGDTLRAPYGGQSLEVIKSYAEDIVSFLVNEKKCKMIVVACNTATAAALEHLRSIFSPIPIVGMEPAVKPAIKNTKTKKIGVLATKGTFDSQRYKDLIVRFASDAIVFQNPCVGLVDMIENREMEDSISMRNFLKPILLPMLRQKVDTIVLGCTHYPLVMNDIKHIVGEKTYVIDPAWSVATHIDNQLNLLSLKNEGKERVDNQFYVTKHTRSFERAVQFFFKSTDIQKIIIA